MPGYKARTIVTDRNTGGGMKNLVSDIVSGNERFNIETMLKAQSGSFKISQRSYDQNPKLHSNQDSKIWDMGSQFWNTRIKSR